MATKPMETSSEANAEAPRVLIADDQPDVLEALRLLLKSHGYGTDSAASPAQLREAVARREYDLILMDLNYARDTTSGREGLNLVAELQAVENAPPIVVMTGWATVGLAVEAMQRGVGDFVEKPWTNARLLEILQRQIQIGREKREERQRSREESRVQKESKKKREHLEREIEEARATQEGFLPKSAPQLAGYDISGTWQPCRVVGGDYFDFLPYGDDRMGICIGDVAGKGMPAAMLMSNLQAAVRGLASPAIPPDDLCARLNAQIYRNIASDRFITFFYAQLRGESRELRYCAAGHNPPIVTRADGTAERLGEGGGVLGVFPMVSYSMGASQLRSGDRVVMFTDGISEAANADGEEFGDKRLVELVAENRKAGARELQEKILRTVGEFCLGNWHDDATLVVIAVA
ncbi:MAG TPA: SpoIIE family protein phosphatase [Verrucomicrobiae bacterium]|nr:SpoIIE family protein phosphatase [Verrucomicrobiae bacterium]